MVEKEKYEKKEKIEMLIKLFKALKAGQQLKDPQKWKKGQNLVNSCVAVVALAVTVLKMSLPDFLVTDEQVVEIATIIAGVLALVNGYITTASTKKIGVQ